MTTTYTFNVAIKQPAGTDAKAFNAIENAAVISEKMPLINREDRASLTEQDLSKLELMNKFWIERSHTTYKSAEVKSIAMAYDQAAALASSDVNFVFYPGELQFDLSVTVAKNTLNNLTSQKNRLEHEYNDAGEIISSNFVAGIDDDAAEFYVKTLSKNLRRYFEAPISSSFIVQQLAAAAAKGIIEAQEKSGMTNEELDVALTRAKDGFKERDRRQFLEIIALNSNVISEHTKKKCTHYAFNSLQDRMKATEIWKKTHTISNGKIKLKLSDVAQTIKKRVSEMFCESIGLQQEAEAAGMQWASVVVTATANKHPNPASGNNTWDGTTPSQTNKTFSRKFARVRAMLAKKRITLVGFWTREAHTDATPHVNYLIYFKKGEEEIVEAAFNKHFKHSKNAVKFKLGEKVTYIDDDGKEQPAASFSSYAMKYFMKFLSETPDQKTLEEAAWASTWNIRRFGFFGLPPIAIWRRMRKSEYKIEHKPELEELRLACRSNDFAKFIRLCGGLGIKRNKRDFQTVRENSIVVGVEHVKSGEQHINKKLGEWVISQQKEEVSITTVDEKDRVTGEVSYAMTEGQRHRTLAIAVAKGNINGTSEAHFNEKVTLVLNSPRRAEGATKKPELKSKIHEKEAQNWLDDDIYEYIASIKYQNAPAERQLTADQRKISREYAQMH